MMASNIDPTVPTAGNATTASVRANFSTAADEITALQAKTENVTTITAYAATLLDDATAADARTTLELGSMATQSANSVAVTGGSITGITDLAVADGGTGASTASVARTNLGLVIGTDVQAYDAGLADIAGLATTDGNFIVGNGANWITESGSTARTSLGLGTIATQDATNVNIDGGAIDGAAIGGTTPAAGAFTTLQTSGNLIFNKEGSDLLAQFTCADNANIATIRCRRANGNLTSPTVVSNGQTLGQFHFSGYDGTAYQSAAFIRGIVGGVPGAGDMPGAILMFVSPDGSATPVVRFSILANGSCLFSAASGAESLRTVAVTNAVNRLEISGAVTGSGPSVAAAGSDTNISLGLSPKGTGNIVVPIANVPDYADDAAAAAGGVVVGGIYRTASVLKIRVS